MVNLLEGSFGLGYWSSHVVAQSIPFLRDGTRHGWNHRTTQFEAGIINLILPLSCNRRFPRSRVLRSVEVTNAWFEKLPHSSNSHETLNYTQNPARIAKSLW